VLLIMRSKSLTVNSTPIPGQKTPEDAKSSENRLFVFWLY
jgi:hypothetical protein